MLRQFFLAVSNVVILAGSAFARTEVTQSVRTPRIGSSALSACECLPIQDGGRVKPLSTFARFLLLRLSGSTSLALDSGERMGATEWLLELLFRPELAAERRCFLVQDARTLESLGAFFADRKKRDRYAYAELQSSLPKLFELAHRYASLEAGERSSVEDELVRLAENVSHYLRLNRQESFAVVPPRAATDEVWLSPPELGAAAAEGHLTAEHASLQRAFERCVEAGSAAAEFEASLAALAGELVALAESRGAYDSVVSEHRYYRVGLLTWGWLAFLLAFTSVACLWLRPRERWLYGAAFTAAAAGTLALVAAIVWRCLIRGRPPVSTLYETVLFVTAAAVLVALSMELLHRRRVALSVAIVLGALGLFVAHGYETLDKQDTMPSLVAVLDTNFWLATHVTAITLGYSAGLLAAAFASAFLVCDLCAPRWFEAATRRSWGRMVYGVICFGLFFALVGTILGGIWANESWGRFWGWDPKENGALLIVLTQIALLHARQAGLLRERGVCMAAAFGGIVVAFSWWGVNLLGVGLHSYGFTSGVHSALWTYYGVQGAFIGAGALAWTRERRRERSSRQIAARRLPEARRRAA